MKRLPNLGKATGTVLLFFEDEAGFGRISKTRACWAPKKQRPSVPCHHIREYRYAYGAVDPHHGDNFFLITPTCNGNWTERFLEELSKKYPDDLILLIMDNAAWHKAKALKIPENIELAFIPPYTPEMNPIEQIWAEMRKRGFGNRVFKSLEAVIDQLCLTINELSNEDVKSITGRKWIKEMLI